MTVLKIETVLIPAERRMQLEPSLVNDTYIVHALYMVLLKILINPKSKQIGLN